MKISRDIFNSALGGIVDIRAFIHRVTFSSEALGYLDLKTMFDKIAVKKADYVGRKFKYKKTAIIHFSDGVEMNVLYSPHKVYMPYSIMSLSHPTANLMKVINKKVSELNSIIKESTGFDAQGKEIKLSSVEFTIDFYCRNSTVVGDLYYLLRRYSFVPYCKGVRMLGGEFTGFVESGDYSEAREMNSVTQYRYSEKEFGIFNKVVKIYERGQDCDNRGKDEWWAHNKCDRVRYEVTARREFLKKIDITTLTLDEILNNMQFSELFFPKDKESTGAFFRLKHFNKKFRNNIVHVPMEQDEYIVGIKDENVSLECFQNEYIKVAREYKALKKAEDKAYRGISHKTGDSFEFSKKHDIIGMKKRALKFTKLRTDVQEAIRKFEDEWRSSVK